MLPDEVVVAALANVGAPVTPWEEASVGAVPRITYFRVSDRDNGHLAGAGPERATFQIDVWAKSRSAARLLADQCKVALRAGATVGSITGNPDDSERDVHLFRSSFDVSIW